MKDGKEKFEFDCVTGDSSHANREGVFHIFRKEKIYTSHKYHVPMNYARFFTDDGEAIPEWWPSTLLQPDIFKGVSRAKSLV